jgi:lipopolysaccharide heptosyltransferase I
MANPQVLVVKLSAIGDVVLSTAAVRALKRHMPDARITWVVEPKSAGVLEGNPDIDEIVIWRRDKFRDAVSVVRELRRRRFDYALDFQGLARSGIITLLSGARKRIGYADGRERSNLAYNVRYDCPEKPHGLRCALGMLSVLDIECDEADGAMRVAVTPEESAAADEALAGLGVEPGDRLAALVPATSREFKHWREDGWAEIADKLWSEFGLRSLFLGAGGDIPLIERIISMTKAPAVSAAGLTKLKMSAVLVAKTELAIAVDTGLMHVASALGKPTIGIFSTTSAWRNHIDNPNFRMLRKKLDCVPCGRRPACDEWRCIREVSADDVIAAVRELTTESAPEESRR